jgi:hypothetical protein
MASWMSWMSCMETADSFLQTMELIQAPHFTHQDPDHGFHVDTLGRQKNCIEILHLE